MFIYVQIHNHWISNLLSMHIHVDIRVWDLEGPQRLIWQAYACQNSFGETFMLVLVEALENPCFIFPKDSVQRQFDRSNIPLGPVESPFETLGFLVQWKFDRSNSPIGPVVNSSAGIQFILLSTQHSALQQQYVNSSHTISIYYFT